ncbi:MAG: ATPase domain-containing protein [Candidatus Nanoarchaeia archaeon]|nr:ATPase domain-containing protein [Candidatus Nanoarchaeia archaeon]MDD5588097.1 ATPase domain-containing protein [Candidatus Nanoarchaeia archaeon]
MKIPKNKAILIVVVPENYHKSIIEISKELQDEKTCYVTINKGFEALIDDFKKNKINSENFIVIDCVTKTIVNTKPEKNCIFISSPNALTELSLAIGKNINNGALHFIIDSLSNMLIYYDNETISKFVQDLIQKVRKKNKTLVLIISSKDKKSKLFDEIETLVDNTMEV